VSYTAEPLQELAHARAAHAERTAEHRAAVAELDRAFAQAAATWSYAEIAVAVGCSKSEVERRVHAHRNRASRQT
jgi:DNA-directed RNA polymerase specialized sigma24 family protein